MEQVVKMENICKSYFMGKEELTVLKNISLSVEKGEYLAILGASGSGKSTLMNLIGCMDNADKGKYYLEGTDISACSDGELTELRNRKIGFIFQKYHLIPQYTILQNVILPLLIRGYTRKKAAEEAEKVIELVKLTERMKHRPGELSGGQQQRVAIARALVTSPALLLADEPTGALDSATGLEILALFKRLNELGNTIIMITHDKKVAGFSKKTVNLEDGVLQWKKS